MQFYSQQGCFDRLTKQHGLHSWAPERMSQCTADEQRDVFISLIHRAERSQIRQQIRSIFTVQVDLVGEKLQMFNIRDLMTRNAILFHLGDDPFTPGGLGVASHADILLARWGGVRDEPKECLRGRLALGFSWCKSIL